MLQYCSIIICFLLYFPAFAVSNLYKDIDEKSSFFKKYKQFLDEAKTELHTVEYAVDLAKSHGFSEYHSNNQIKFGAKLFFVNRQRSIVLAVIGEKNIRDGINIVAAHNDSPRIDLKAKPLYSSQDFALFQTVYYGGIKKYQWMNIPLELHGKVFKKDGSEINIRIGNKASDPIFVIPDAAPHVDKPLRNRNYSDVVDGEELDPVVGVKGAGAGSLVEQVTSLLQSKYSIEDRDFASSELSLTPAMPARDLGFDGEMTAGYGQDDRLSCYCAMQALFSLTKQPLETAMVYLVDNEETGSVNNTGAQSTFLRDVIATITEAQNKEIFSENVVRQALKNSEVLSSDVCDGVNPLYPQLSEQSNAGRLGQGVAIKKYGRSFDANGEFIAKIRRILDAEKIPWQTASYKVESGGGGTIGGFMSKENMEIIDVGVPILSMHSTYEISAKSDVWNLYTFFSAFYLQ